MIIRAQIHIDEMDLKCCIVAAYQKAHGEMLNLIHITDFAIGDKITNSDIDNLLAGSCLAELIKLGRIEMERIA